MAKGFTVKAKSPVKKKANVNTPQYDYAKAKDCLLYTSPSPRDGLLSRMPSSA